MEKNKIKRSIIIPAYAEEKYITNTLEKLFTYLSELNWLDSTEVIVVTADASDRTQSLTAAGIKKFPINKHVQPGSRVGKGRDVKAGMKVARGNNIIFMDADLATPLAYIKPAFEVLEKEGGMVIGVRNLSKIHKGYYRHLTSVLSNLLIRFVIGFGIKDSQCGFKGFDELTTRLILNKSNINGWGFDFEFIKIAKIHKINISKIDIPDWLDPKAPGTGLSGDSQLEAMKSTFKELFKVKIYQFKGLYK